MHVETRDLQLELLKIMKVFHQICEENGLKYYMLGGTCLGAIRHKGFIPWDDDMDVGMPRKDYDLFCRKATELLPENLELKYYRTDKNSPFHFAKLINSNTTLIEPKYHDYVEGIYIDVFPLDNLVKYNLSNKLRCHKIWFKHACIMNHCSTENKAGIVRKAFLRYSKMRNLDRLHTSLEKLMVKESNMKTAYLCNFLGAWKEREIIPADIFEQPVLYTFENCEFYGPKDTNAYLTSLYGDYMKLPPKEQQVNRHDYYYVSLEKSYKDYKGVDNIK